MREIKAKREFNWLMTPNNMVVERNDDLDTRIQFPRDFLAKNYIDDLETWDEDHAEPRKVEPDQVKYG